MTKFITDVKVIEEDEVVGATVEVKEDIDGETKVHIVNTESYNTLVNDINTIKTTGLRDDNLVEKINAKSSEIKVGDSDALGGIPADEYSKSNHKHPDDYAPLNHIGVRSTQRILGHAKIINNLDSNYYIDGEALSAAQGNVLRTNAEALGKRTQELEAKIKILDKMQDIILDDGGVIVSSDVSYHYSKNPKTIQFYVFDRNGEPIRDSEKVGSIIVVRIKDGKVYRVDSKYGTDSNGIITRTIMTKELLKSDAVGMYIVYIKFKEMTDHCMMYIYN